MKQTPERTRAVDEQDKAARRQSLLDAAHALFLLEQPALPSVQSIATRAGLAKGTVYLYFCTKEAVFLSLLEDFYGQLLDQLQRELTASDELIDTLSETILAFTRKNPAFLPLAAMASSSLEANVDTRLVMRFKEMLYNKTQALSHVICEKIPQASLDHCSILLVHTHAHMLGLWQMQQMPAVVRDSLHQAKMELLAPSFDAALKIGLKSLWGEGASFSRQR